MHASSTRTSTARSSTCSTRRLDTEPSADQPNALLGPPEARPVATRRILANTTWRAIAEIGSKLATLALVVVMARELGESGFGVFTFGFAFATLVTALAGFGQDVVLTREVARDPRRFDRYFVNTLVLKCALALPALLVSSAAAYALGVDAETRWVVLLLGVAVVTELLTMTCLAAFQAFERLVYMPVVMVTQRALAAGVGIAALLAGAGVVAVSAVYAAAACVAFVLGLALVDRKIGRPRLSLDPGFWWPLMRIAAPIGVAGVLGTILFRVDTAILAWFEPKEVVGQYGAAFRLFEATLFLSWSVGTAIYPVLSRLTAETDPPLGSVFDRSLKLVIALTLPLAVAAAILGEGIVELLFGADFAEAGTALVLLAPAIAFYPVAHVAGVLLYAGDRQLSMVAVYGTGAAANVVVNVILIAAFSLEGAAVATSLTWLLLAAALVALAARTSGSVAMARIVVGPLVASAAAALVMAAFRAEVVSALGAGAAAYLLVLVAYERRVHPEDAAPLGDFLRRRA
ncbi:MAG TPA: flippase [Gaiellaceae bacterium]|nr:flippase [Gaiellaceae bacterium]